MFSLKDPEDQSELINAMSRRDSVKAPTVEDRAFRARIVQLIRIDKNPEAAIQELSSHYNIEEPKLRMGLPKAEKRALGCYVTRDKTIYLSTMEYLYDPYVIIHEFYHHLRNVQGKHRGTERHARDFAMEFLKSA